MAEPGLPVWCVRCGVENAGGARLCRNCGRELALSERERRAGTAFLLNELEALRRDGLIARHTYILLRDRYRSTLGAPPEPIVEAATPLSVPAPTVAPAAPVTDPIVEETPPTNPHRPPPPAPPKEEGPGWLAEQQANLLLYLGAFLIIIATLIFVTRSETEIGNGVRIALLILYTLVFLGAGLLCMRFDRVRQAGVVFFAVGALLVPMNFAAAYVFFLEGEDADPTGLWLAGSLSGALFYIAASMNGLGRWYPVPAVISVASSLAAFLRFIGAPAEAYPGAFMLLAFLYITPSLVPLGRVTNTFEAVGFWAAHAIMPVASMAALVLAVYGYRDDAETSLGVGTLWYLPPTFAVAAAFYALPALRGLGAWQAMPATIAAVAAYVSALAAIGIAAEAYPAALITLCFLLVLPSLSRIEHLSETFGEATFQVANVIAPASVIGAFWILSSDSADVDLGIASVWYLPPTLAAGATFYALIALVRGTWAGTPAVLVATLALGALLFAGDTPVEAYPGSFIAFAFVVSIPALLALRRFTSAFGIPGFFAAHLIVPTAALVALSLTVATGYAGDDPWFELNTRWYLPPTISLALLFYAAHAVAAWRSKLSYEPAMSVTALSFAAATLLSFVYAIEVGEQWYGPAVAVAGFAFAGGIAGIGPRWFGQRYLGWMAVGCVTASWALFEGIYGDYLRHGAGVHFAAAAFYLVAAFTTKTSLPLLRDDATDGAEEVRLPAAIPLIYGAALTLGIAFYQLIDGADTSAGTSAFDLAWPFFGLSLAIAACAATLRLWRPDLRVHAYAVALGMSLFVLLSSVDAEGQVTTMLAAYAAVAAAYAIWEREPFALASPATYGFFAVLAAFRYYDPDDALFPLAFSLVSFLAFAVQTGLLLSRHEHEDSTNLFEDWPLALLAIAAVYAAAAPIAGWVRLSYLADPQGFVGAESFEETMLYQTSAASFFILGLLVAAHGALARNVSVIAGSTALVMVAVLLEIGHFRPGNVQAYTVPLGVYLLVCGLVAARIRELPKEAQVLVEPLQVLGAFVLMAPTLVDAWEGDGWTFALVLLAEAMVILALALVQRLPWLLTAATGFVVFDALRYLFDAARVMPNWATLAIAGLVLLAAGTAILFSRERWTEWQESVEKWWKRDPLRPDGMA